jgi:DUF1009 family protein
VERTLGLMGGAGALPARMAAAARGQGWRVVAFAFGDAPGLAEAADLAVPARLTALDEVLAGLVRERASAALFAGKFWLADVLATEAPDATGRRIAGHAGAVVDTRLADAVVATLGGLGIEVLDQRPFIGEWLAGAGCWSARAPSAEAWDDIRRGLDVARLCAGARVGQTVVVRRGAVTAVEALEGTTAAVRRGTAIAGPGATVVKAVAPDNDYRFDTPAIGPDTIEAAVAGGAAVVAFEAGRVLLLDRERLVRLADEGGLAVVGVDDVGTR